MGIIVQISRTEIEKVPSLLDETARLCVGAVEEGESLLLIPLGGKLIEILRVLAQHDVQYQLRKSAGDDV